MNAHPSALQLDSGEADAHVRECARCQAFLAREAVTMPAGLVTSRQRFQWWMPALAFAMVGGAVWLSEDSVRSKGAPAVAVYVKHGDTVTAWERGPLAPGDAIRLEVAPEEYTHVQVLARDHDQVVTLWDGPVHGKTLLPLSFVADAESDWLRVVFRNGARTHAVDVRFAQ